MSDTSDPFATLGVSPDATPEEVSTAFRRLAQIYHPDRLHSAPDDVRSEAERRMKEISAAYSAIQAGARPSGRATHDSASAAERAYRQAVGYQGPHCMICGHAPVADVTFREGFGFILARQVRTLSGPLCRDCARSIFRDAQNGTLLKGWWGVISFFANIMYVFANIASYQTASRLSAPKPTPKSFLTPMHRPLPPGPPLVRRVGLWVPLTITALVLITALANQAPKTTTPTTITPATVEATTAGTCGRISGLYIVEVPCTDPSATLRLVATRGGGISAEIACPSTADYYTEEGNTVYCWERRF